MSEPVVLHEVDERGVATIRLNRPAVNNAYNGEMIEMLLAVCGELRASAAVRVVVIRGNGRHFQAGADLTWIDEVRGQGEEENPGGLPAHRAGGAGSQRVSQACHRPGAWRLLRRGYWHDRRV